MRHSDYLQSLGNLAQLYDAMGEHEKGTALRDEAQAICSQKSATAPTSSIESTLH